MATDARNLYFSFASDAAIRSWGGGINAALKACGLIQTSDTGQIDWNTYLRPGATSSSVHITMGYEIYRFDDALQATRPVFIKIRYHYVNEYNNYYGNTTLGLPTFLVQVGTGTNGAGTLTGLLSGDHDWVRSNPQSYNTTSNSTSYTQPQNSRITPMHAFGDGSTIVAHLGATALDQPYWWTANSNAKYAGFPGFFWIERTRDATGVPNGDGVFCAWNNWPSANAGSVATSTAPMAQVLSFTRNAASVIDSYLPITWPGELFGSGSTATDISVWPPSVSTPKRQYVMGMLGIYKSDLSLSSVIDIPMLGGTRKYRSLAGIGGSVQNDNARSRANNQVPSGALVMRWDA